MIMNHFLRTFAASFGGFPKNYLSLDIETSGVNSNEDLILQVGYCLVEEGKPVEQVSVVLNWPDSGLVEEDWLRDRLERTRKQIEFAKDGRATGKRYDFTYEFLQTGEPPVATLDSFHGLLMDLRRATYGFVAHNGYNFDGKMLASHFKNYLHKEWSFLDNELWDTGMIEKASQLNSVPHEGDTLRSFSARVAAGRFKGVFWNLGEHCVKKYALDQKHGIGTMKNCDAGFDAWLDHLLFEEFKLLAAQNPTHPEQPPF